jgi:surface carbohydrate biosynthesis protein
LAVQLCHQGIACDLVPMNLCGEEMWRLAPDFVLLHNLRDHNQALFSEMRAAGIELGVLDTEGGVFENLDVLGKLLARDIRLRQQVRCYCCWGPKVAKYLVDGGWLEARQTVITGSPRTDFYTSAFRELTHQLSHQVAHYANNLVLINSNFTQGNPGQRTVEEQLSEMVELLRLEPDDARAKQQIDIESTRQFAMLANRLARRFPRATFVFRPHPFERLETYQELLEPLGNLHCLREGTVDGWIARAKAVIQSGCSTAIEAGIAGVPALQPCWIPVWRRMPTAEQASIPCRQEEELVAALDSILNGKQDVIKTPSVNDIVRDWFCAIDGRAYQRVADAIIANLPPRGRQQRIKECQRRVYGLNKARVGSSRWIKANVQVKLGLPPNWSFGRWRAKPISTERYEAWDRSAKYFDAAKVAAIVAAIHSTLDAQASTSPNVTPVSVRFPYAAVCCRSVSLTP